MSIGIRLRSVRVENKLNQTDFADKIGVSQGRLSDFEIDKRPPSKQTLIAIEYSYGIKKEWLLTGEGPKYVSEREHIVGDSPAYY